MVIVAQGLLFGIGFGIGILVLLVVIACFSKSSKKGKCNEAKSNN